MALPPRFWLRPLLACLALCLGLQAQGPDPMRLAARVQRLIACESPENRGDGRFYYQPTKQVIAEGAPANEMVTTIVKGEKSGPPGTGLGYFGYFAALDKDGKPLLILAVRCESGITTIHPCTEEHGYFVHAIDGDPNYRESKVFTKAIYEAVKQHAPENIESMNKFYRKVNVGTSVEQLMFGS